MSSGTRTHAFFFREAQSSELEPLTATTINDALEEARSKQMVDGTALKVFVKCFDEHETLEVVGYTRGGCSEYDKKWIFGIREEELY